MFSYSNIVDYDSDGLLNGGTGFNGWRKYHHPKSLAPQKENYSDKDAFITSWLAQGGPDGYQFSTHTTQSNLTFNHSFLESPPITARIYPGDFYQLNFEIKDNLGSQDFLFDINIATGDQHAQNPHGCTNGSSNFLFKCDYDMNRGKSYFSTFGRPIKWQYNIKNLDNPNNYLIGSELFVGTEMPIQYDKFYIQVGPATSDNKYSADVCGPPYNVPTVCNSNYYSTNYSYSGDAGLQEGFRTGDVIPSRFGLGLPMRMMQKWCIGIDPSSFMDCQGTQFGTQKWWKYTTGSPCTYPNNPTYINNNVELDGFKITRYSKNPYMLYKVRKVVANGDVSDPLEYWQDVTNTVFKYDNVLAERKLLTKNAPFLPQTLPYWRTIVRLKEIIQLPRKVTNVIGPHTYPSVKFEYASIATAGLTTHFVGSYIQENENLRSKYYGSNYTIINKIIDPLGKETSIEYFDITGEQSSKSYITSIANNSVTFGAIKSRQNNLANGSYFGNEKEYNSTFSVSFVVKYLKEVDAQGQKIWTYNYGKLKNINLQEPYSSNYSLDFRYRILRGFDSVTVQGPAYFINQGPKSTYYHHTDFLLWGKLYESRNYDLTNNMINRKLSEYKPVLAFELPMLRYKRINGFYDYADYSDCMDPKITEYTAVKLKQYLIDKLDYIATIEGIPVNPPDPPIFNCSVKDAIGQPLGKSNCNCYEDYEYLSPSDKELCESYFLLVKQYTANPPQFFTYENEFIHVPIPSGSGVFNTSYAYGPLNYPLINSYNPFLLHSFFIKKTKDQDISYDTKCSSSLDSTNLIKEYTYFDVDYRGRVQSNSFEKWLTQIPLSFCTDDKAIPWEPSWQLHSITTYSKELPESFTREEYYYLYDIINDPLYLDGSNFFKATTYPHFHMFLTFFKDRTLMVQKKIISKAQNQDSVANSTYYVYQGGWKAEDNEGYIEEEIDNPEPENQWPCPEGKGKKIFKVNGNKFPYYDPIGVPPSGITQGAQNSSIPNIPGIDTEFPYLTNTIGSKILLSRILKQISASNDDKIRFISSNGIVEIHADTLQVKHILSRNSYTGVNREKNERGLITRYYYEPIHILQYKDCHEGSEFVNTIWLNNFLNQPVAITQGYERNDSLRTEYTYYIQDNQVKTIKDPNTTIIKYEYDDYGRLANTYRNNVLLSTIKYKNFNNDLNKPFALRTLDNYVRTVTYNNSIDSSIRKEYFDPLGNPVAVEIDGSIKENKIYDIYNRVSHSTKPRIGTNIFHLSSGISLDDLMQYEYETAPRTRVTKISDYGVNINSNQV
jgi:YD repeat-containing protein